MKTEQRYFKSDEVWNMARHWSQRVLLASFTADPMGLIVRAVLGVNTRVGPAMGLSAEIGKDGIVRTALRGPRGDKKSDAHPLGSVISFRDEFRRLADHCRLPDNEREELFEHVRKWCGKDKRSTSDLSAKPLGKRG